jgi:hypothetical protein
MSSLSVSKKPAYSYRNEEIGPSITVKYCSNESVSLKLAVNVPPYWDRLKLSGLLKLESMLDHEPNL